MLSETIIASIISSEDNISSSQSAISLPQISSSAELFCSTSPHQFNYNTNLTSIPVESVSFSQIDPSLSINQSPEIDPRITTMHMNSESPVTLFQPTISMMSTSIELSDPDDNIPEGIHIYTH